MRVELEWLATEVIAELPTAQARTEVLRHPELWPAPGGEELADVFGSRCWVSVVSYRDGLEVRDIGWFGS
ncbi:hypothetical protein [Streptomyces sp900116325]|uniref:hypothetical protein n=1 Tax=unclassified Streptomyces TaxID=2593676 RepID=UPI0033AFEE48